MNNKLNHIMLAAMASSLPLTAGAVTIDGADPNATQADYTNVSVETGNMADSVELTASEGVVLSVTDETGSSQVLVMGCHADANNTGYVASTGGGSLESTGPDGLTSDCATGAPPVEGDFDSLGSG